MSFPKTLGMRLREMYSTQSFADVVNSVKQSMSVPVEITPEVSCNHFFVRQQSCGNVMLLPAATKLGQGNVFTGICDSVQGGVVCDQVHPPGPGTPP